MLSILLCQINTSLKYKLTSYSCPSHYMFPIFFMLESNILLKHFSFNSVLNRVHFTCMIGIMLELDILRVLVLVVSSLCTKFGFKTLIIVHIFLLKWSKSYIGSSCI